jgi:DNA-binding response OmpR family regulator
MSPSPSILVIEDDDEIASLVVRSLGREGFEAHRAADGERGVDSFLRDRPDLVVLDLGLPGIDGFGVLARLRREGDCPVIILSCRGEEGDKVAGLGLGADDYLTKPFSMAELAARVKARLRRRAGMYADGRGRSESTLSSGDLELDLKRCELRRSGAALKLTQTEFEIMKLLLSEPGRVFTKAQIIEAVWGPAYVAEDNSLMAHLSNLRRKLGDEASHPLYIETVWGIGYRLKEGRRDAP